MTADFDLGRVPTLQSTTTYVMNKKSKRSKSKGNIDTYLRHDARISCSLKVR